MATEKHSATVGLTIITVIVMSGLVGCRGNSAEAFAKGIDELAGRASAQVIEREGAAAASKGAIKARVKTALRPVEQLSNEEMLKLVERACTAKDMYDLTDDDGLAQAAADYRKYGPHASEYVALLREFGKLIQQPRISQGVVVSVGSICAAAG